MADYYITLCFCHMGSHKMKVADNTIYTVTRASGVIFLLSPYFLWDISPITLLLVGYFSYHPTSCGIFLLSPYFLWDISPITLLLVGYFSYQSYFLWDISPINPTRADMGHTLSSFDSAFRATPLEHLLPCVN